MYNGLKIALTRIKGVDKKENLWVSGSGPLLSLTESFDIGIKY